MIIRNFYDDSLAQASYLVACGATGEAAIIDPLRDIEPYLRMAKKLGLRITAAMETHIHADYLSGTRELSAGTGATMYLSDEGGVDWQYEFANEPKAIRLKDGDVITLGNLSLKAIHTPGHTPEHMAYLLTDHPVSDMPHSLFSGDFLFVGDVGRPDLLERAANMAGTMEKGAGDLYRSLKKLEHLADSLLVWPGHGSGSACGKSLGGSPVSTLGYERATNWALQAKTEAEFVTEVLAGQPEPPRYFREMKLRNKVGPVVLGSIPSVPQVHEPVGVLVDIRSASAIRHGYVPNSIAIPEGMALTTWAGWLLEYDEPVTLIAESQGAVDSAARDFALIGLDSIRGWMEPPASEEQVATVACKFIPENAFILDVRGLSEYRTAHMASSIHIPLGYLAARQGEIPRDRPVFVHCASGMRSLIGASLLRRAGIDNVTEIEGGLSGVAVNCPQLIAV